MTRDAALHPANTRNGALRPSGESLSNRVAGVFRRVLAMVRMQDGWIVRLVQVTVRRRGWLLEGLTARKAANVATAMADCVMRRERVAALPVMVKIDISPLCSLKCTACVHAEPGDDEVLARQEFRANQKMSLADFRKIIEEVRGKTNAVSLYYLGDPYAHPQHDAMCRVARDAGLNVHSSSHFSYGFSDERLRGIVRSGLTHLTVCVDGLTQETYGRTRVGGKIAQVLDNLERLIRVRRELGSVYPRIEAQFLKFAHNVHELEPARKLLYGMGVEQVEDFWGITDSCIDTDPGRFPLGGPRAGKMLPLCYWPYVGMVVKYNGDVIPCCNYRHGEQYAANGDARPVGNVLKDGLKAVWNSEAYRELRKSVKSPGKYEGSEAMRGNFCHGCPVLFNAESVANESGMYHRTDEGLVALTVGGEARTG